MIISNNQGGLCNRIKSLVSCLRYGKELGVDVRVYWMSINNYDKYNHLLNCSFSKLFQNKLEIDEIPSNIKTYKSTNLMIFKRDKIPLYFDSYNPKNAKYTTSDKYGRNIDFNYVKIPKNVVNNYLPFFKMLKPKDEIQEKINFFAINNFSKNTISVHIRAWAQKNEEVRNRTLFKNGISKFENEMLKYYNTADNYFVSTDSDEIRNYFVKCSKVKDKVIVYPRITKLENSRSFEDGIKEDLIELYLLSKNNFLIGSHNSTFTEVAWWLGGCKKDVIII